MVKKWQQLKGSLEELGIEVLLIDQDPNQPDMVFTANAGTVKDGKVVMSNFKHQERKGEAALYQEWFIKEGYETHALPPSISFEGCGDTILLDDLMIGGYGHRSSLGGLRRASQLLETELVALKLANPDFYHLDTCFCILSYDTAMYYPPAFTPSALKKLKDLDLELVEVDDYDAMRFACNSVVYREHILMPAGPRKIVEELGYRGYRVQQIEADEFLKAGGLFTMYDFMDIMYLNCGVAQLVEQLTVNQPVAGSSPAAAATYKERMQ